MKPKSADDEAWQTHYLIRGLLADIDKQMNRVKAAGPKTRDSEAQKLASLIKQAETAAVQAAQLVGELKQAATA